MFGSTQQPQATGGTSLFGGGTSFGAPQQGQNLFGGNTTSGQRPAFGASTAGLQQPALFRSSFGQTAPSPAPAFGGSTSLPSFGSSGPSAPSFGSFGQQQPAAGSLFAGGTGQTTFGTALTNPAWSVTLGAPQQQQQYEPVRETTMYESLPQSGAFVSKDTVDAVQRHLDSQRQIALQLRNFANVGESASTLAETVRSVRRLLSSAENAQRTARATSTELLDQAKALKGQGDVLAAKAAAPTDNIELPPPLLWTHLDRCEKRAGAYAKEIQRLEAVLGNNARQHPNASNSSQHHSTETSEERLQRLLEAQNDAFMHIAGVIAQLHKRTDDLRSTYKRKRGHDIFSAQDRKDQAERKEIENQIRAEQQLNVFNHTSTQPSLPTGASTSLLPTNTTTGQTTSTTNSLLQPTTAPTAPLQFGGSTVAAAPSSFSLPLTGTQRPPTIPQQPALFPSSTNPAPPVTPSGGAGTSLSGTRRSAGSTRTRRSGRR